MSQQKAPGVNLDSRLISADLLAMYADCESSNGFDKDLYMQKLVSYIVRRDHQVHNHAYHLGKSQRDNEGHANYSQQLRAD